MNLPNFRYGTSSWSEPSWTGVFYANPGRRIVFALLLPMSGLTILGRARFGCRQRQPSSVGVLAPPGLLAAKLRRVLVPP